MTAAARRLLNHAGSLIPEFDPGTKPLRFRSRATFRDQTNP